MKKNQKASLAFKCPIQLNSLVKKEGGYFCTNCSKPIEDFRTKDGNETQELIGNSLQPICGIFKRTQLSDSFLKYALATMLATSPIAFPAFGQEAEIDSIIELELTNTVSCYDEAIIVNGIEKIAEPIGGFEKFLEALSEEINYPDGLKKGGKVYISVVVDTTGKTTQIKVIRGFNEIADKEALRALKALNYPFTPVTQRGITVKSNIIFPVHFKVEKTDEE
ncbi:energy transducer TonB [Flammeovirgaceae bacterium SG7u.111]|nr:energy transducer TonB [Flammeovirgaceae bacterium SG7u.132]WPO37256.1 energy transducer TonB [Flammeovirgaceae bacterium SG7u.111]